MNKLNRRDFLRLAGLVFASGALLPVQQAVPDGAQFFADPQIRFGNTLLRGTSYGAILASSNEGKTWEELTKFGNTYAVRGFIEKNKRIYANVELGSHDFWLRSVDARKWFSV